MRHLHRWLSLLAVATLAGCPGAPTGMDGGLGDAAQAAADAAVDDSWPDTGPYVPGTLDEYKAFAPAMIDALCQRYVRCGELAPEDLESCKRWRLVWTLNGKTQAALRVGARRFDRNAREACLAEANRSDCRPGGPSGPCASAFTNPAAHVGDRCFESNDCIDAWQCAGPMCSRKCVELGFLQPGEPCEDFADCDIQLGVCDTAQGLCVQYVGIGDSCGTSATKQCDPHSAFCSPTASTCEALHDIGGSCSQSGGCKLGLYCREDSAADGGSAGSCQAALGAGAPCVDWTECASKTCDEDLKVCLGLPAAIGSECSATTPCAAGYCDFSGGGTGLCTSLDFHGAGMP